MPPAQLAIIRFMILLAAHLSPTPNAQSRQPLMAFTLLGCGHTEPVQTQLKAGPVGGPRHTTGREAERRIEIGHDRQRKRPRRGPPRSVPLIPILRFVRLPEPNVNLRRQFIPHSVAAAAEKHAEETAHTVAGGSGGRIACRRCCADRAL